MPARGYYMLSYFLKAHAPIAGGCREFSRIDDAPLKSLIDFGAGKLDLSCAELPQDLTLGTAGHPHTLA